MIKNYVQNVQNDSNKFLPEEVEKFFKKKQLQVQQKKQNADQTNLNEGQNSGNHNAKNTDILESDIIKFADIVQTTSFLDFIKKEKSPHQTSENKKNEK